LKFIDFAVNAFTSFEFLFHIYQVVDTSNEHIDEFDFRESESVSVRNIKQTTFSGAVNTTGASFLESKFIKNFFESSVSGNLWDFDVDASSDTGTKVGWASQNVSEMFVPHEFVTISFDGSFKLVQTITPSGKDLFDIAIFLHGDDSDVVFFVDPDQKVLGAVVPDTSSIWPISGHTGGQEKWRNWLIEQKVIVDKLILFSFSHIFQWVVFTSEVTAQVAQTIDDNLFDSSSFSSAAPWWKSVTSNASTGSASRRENVFGVKVVAFEFGWVEASFVFVGWFVTVVSGFNDWIKEFLENFVGFFITGNGTNGHDEWVAWIIDTGLDDVVDGVTGWGLLASESFVHFQSQNVGHVVVVFFEVWVFILSGVSRFVEVRHDQVCVV